MSTKRNDRTINGKPITTLQSYAPLQGVCIWVETKGTGHTFLTVHNKDDLILYTYGRYDDAYLVTAGLMGEGVLIRYTGTQATTYIKKELYRLSCQAYLISDVSKEKVKQIFDQIWNSSSEHPDGKGVAEDIKKFGRVIDHYDLSGNNCTTKVIDVLIKAGTKIFNTNVSIFNYNLYTYKEDFTIPSSLKKFLDEKSYRDNRVTNVTDRMKSYFPNSAKINNLKKVGSLGESSGSLGNSSGSSANSSSSEQMSSGSSPASSAGSVGSSIN